MWGRQYERGAPLPCPSSGSSAGLAIPVHVCCHPCALDLAGAAAREAAGSKKTGGVLQAGMKILKDKLLKGRKSQTGRDSFLTVLQ